MFLNSIVCQFIIKHSIFSYFLKYLLFNVVLNKLLIILLSVLQFLMYNKNGNKSLIRRKVVTKLK